MAEPTDRTEPYAKLHESGGWENEHGAVGPFKPGFGPRSDPRGAFPTGPAIGEQLPDIVATSATGETIDVHAHRAGKAAVVVFYRSAVW